MSSDSPECGTFFFPFSLRCTCFATLLVSTVQSRASAMRVHASPLSLDRLPTLGQHRARRGVPCAVQRFLIAACFSQSSVLTQRQPPSSSHASSPVVSIRVFSKTASPFLLHMSHCLYHCGIQTPWHMTQPQKRMKLGHLQRHR